MIRRLAPLMLIALPAAAFAQAGAQEAAKPISKAELTAQLDADYADIDANKDGKVGTAEITTRLNKSAKQQLAALEKERTEIFNRLDANKDGSISKAEFDTANALPAMPTPNAQPFLARFDTNKDGNISKDEFRSPTLANFDRMDTNKDGTVSVAEQSAQAPKQSPDVGR